MKRQICWTERNEDGIKRDVRVRFHGAHILWQSKRSDSAIWDYDSPPSEADWDTLEGKLRGLYQRGYISLEKQLEQIHKARNP